VQLDYINIGKRIKDIRAKRNISQEYLAELADLSIAHTSHIENGSTKASLPALVRIANALEASLDELVCDSLIKAKDVFNNEILQEVKDCNETETRIIADTIKALKASLRKRGQNLSII
jgi:transcriptional regulator with XRE-family HTH domain